MKEHVLRVWALVVLLAAQGCGILNSEPDTARRVPVPVDVAPETIPRPFSSSTYFGYGSALAGGPDSVLAALLHNGVDVREAWYPGPALCMQLLYDQMIVQLSSPDARIASFGFTQDSSRVRPECFSTWKFYDFAQAK
ncbi:MAG TPA: hypothetical protein VFG50_03200 [Rhodothermales bacterium]|nr:hypothetical protein [Rhodothermales bacterium]